jgi:hypothetical protein
MANIDTLRNLYSGDFTVTDRPTPVAGDMRIGWGQSLLLLLLYSSRSQKCSLQKVHFLAHLSRTAASRQLTRDVLRRAKEPKDISIRVEPWINRAAAFAIANGYVSSNGKQFQLTESGKKAAAALQKEGVLAAEFDFLQTVGKLATEQVVEHIMKMEDF